MHEDNHAKTRPLRVMLVANDGLSAGHVVRSIAIARGLGRRAALRRIEVRVVLATTSQAHTLVAAAAVAIVQLPAPAVARAAGFSDQERRRLVRGTLEGLATSFAPDLLVVDTFPSGPHAELAGVAGMAKRALVRRSVPETRIGDETLCAGLHDFHLAIVADDPFAHEVSLPLPVVRVPPITLGEARDGETRDAARATLGLPLAARVILVTGGGGGDVEARRDAAAIAAALTRVDPEVVVALAHGPLAHGPLAHGPLAHDPLGHDPLGPRIHDPLGPRIHDQTKHERVRTLRVAPLQPLLAAFDGAFSPAGYNTAHELAKAAVPAALFVRERPFDDQSARALRFERASLATTLASFDDPSIARALAWMTTATRPTTIEAGGADRAADALLDFATSASVFA